MQNNPHILPSLIISSTGENIQFPHTMWGIAIDDGRVVFVQSDGKSPWVAMTSIPAKLLEYVPVFLEQHYPLLNTAGYPKINKDVVVRPEGMSLCSD